MIWERIANRCFKIWDLGLSLIDLLLKVLVVQEKYYVPPLSGLWKIPTSFILEDDAQFEKVMAFRWLAKKITIWILPT
ncbi:nudix hydrolase 8-like [Solanum tuberosum]|uniref:Uncharacterized protein n=1 Tax=Solanum tuberosum TaxID=4113 RepID=M1BYT8_SOLTU|nr:PREDICTED: nudix hydrolase 8-like [Solanum tuberosum]XP_015166039.1 PREDICTED: nudix hydrolase 8-like [Solanum tuberosum]XP_015166041.1 PREDICTED: nudix hydrolase 8-like [Solanum tuberosum]XP_015166042.1 PREDICTED: nudix hydrolase 8-like [Solanum tuberosum]XP_015166043.1 PREDICTED: nudix hydrolase 8-like [Solanum tuberosum]XP_015166044.1 PREDICTED: nudix hydrolase 8-like [Solanum tuberosum]